MPKTLFRLVVFLLLPGLVAESVNAAAFAGAPSAQSSTLTSTREQFEKEALMLPLAAGRFATLHPQSFREVFHFLTTQGLSLKAWGLVAFAGSAVALAFLAPNEQHSKFVLSLPEEAQHILRKSYTLRMINNPEGVEQAISFLQEGIKKYPQAGALYTELANCFMNLRQNNAAIGPAEEAVKLTPDNFIARSTLASAYFYAGRVSEAIVQKEIQVKLNPLEHRAKKVLAGYYERLAAEAFANNRTADALRSLKRADRLDPGNDRILSKIQTAYKKIHQPTAGSTSRIASPANPERNAGAAARSGSITPVPERDKHYHIVPHGNAAYHRQLQHPLLGNDRARFLHDEKNDHSSAAALADSRDIQIRQKASEVLYVLRQEPMKRGHVKVELQDLTEQIEEVLEQNLIPEDLGTQIAGQMVKKIKSTMLGEPRIWREIATLLREEMNHLSASMQLPELQIVQVLPKLSATQVVELFNKLREADPKIARSIAVRAFAAPDPLGRAETLLKNFHAVVAMVERTAATGIARTVAARTFNGPDPLGRAETLLKNFHAVVAMVEKTADAEIARTIAARAFDASDPLGRVEKLLKNYHAVIDMVEKTADAEIARSIATKAFDAPDPLELAETLLKNYSAVVVMVEKTADAEIARSIASTACTSSDPIGRAEKLLTNYHTVVAMVEKTADAEIARMIASRAFDAPDPLELAETLLKNYSAVVVMVEKTADAEIARTIASIACVSSDPTGRAEKLLTNYHTVVAMVEKTADAEIARLIAIRAFDAPDPLGQADALLKNYNAVVAIVERTASAEIARTIAARAFDASDPSVRADTLLKNYNAGVAMLEKTPAAGSTGSPQVRDALSEVERAATPPAAPKYSRHFKLIRDHILREYREFLGPNMAASRLFVDSEFPDNRVKDLVYMYPDGLENALLLHLHLVDGEPTTGRIFRGIWVPISLNSSQVVVGRPWIESIYQEEPWSRGIEADAVLPPDHVDRMQMMVQKWIDERQLDARQVLEDWKAGQLEPQAMMYAISPGEGYMLRTPDVPRLLKWDPETKLYSRREPLDQYEEEVVYRLAQRGLTRQTPAPARDEAMMILRSWGLFGFTVNAEVNLPQVTRNREVFRKWLEANRARFKGRAFLIQLRQLSRRFSPPIPYEDLRQVSHLFDLVGRALRNDEAPAAVPHSKLRNPGRESA